LFALRPRYFVLFQVRKASNSNKTFSRKGFRVAKRASMEKDRILDGPLKEY
jgi:hypothetical protein